MQLKNSAAYLPLPLSPLSISTAPFPTAPLDDELIIETFAVAVNPIDWKIQDAPPGKGIYDLVYPAILGEDVAGEVIEVGKGLKGRFEIGDRVVGFGMGLGLQVKHGEDKRVGEEDGGDDEGEGGKRYGGFQMYVVLKGLTVCVVPDEMGFDEVVVLGLSVSTAAAGLFMELKKGSGGLGLDYPTTGETGDGDGGEGLRGKRKDKEEDKGWLLLWGGSSSVGSSVIQLAKAAGYSVATTASPANYGYCYGLGASFVLDYHIPNIVEILTGVLGSQKVVGAYDAIGDETTVKQCADILAGAGGGRVVSVVGAPEGLPKGTEVVRIGSGNIASQEPDVARKVWGEYLPEALAKGLFKPAPGPLVVGTGLASIQKGLDRQKKGVSAKKVVVMLSEVEDAM